MVPFYDHFKKHIQAANDTFFKEIREFEQIFDDLEAEYEQCVLDNKNLTIEKKNLLIRNDCLIAECLEKDICSIVLTSDIVVPPSSNCLCEDLRSACDREHTKVLELEAEVLKQQKMVIESEKRNSHLQKNHIDLQLKFQNYKQCIDTSSASNAIFEINKLRKQLQGKDDTIRNLDAQINIMKVLNVGSTEGSCDQQALETDRIQLKDTITSLRIQLDGLKVENVSLQRRYDELSKANTHSRTAYTEKLSALTAENTKLKAQVTGKTSSGPSTSETPKVLAPGMYNLGSKYIPPPKRANWVKPTPLPKKKQVTFQEPPRTSNRPTQKPPVQQNKKPNVSVNLSTRTKPATEPRKPMPKSDTRNHRIWPSKSENARRAADHNRNLNFDHNQFVIRSLKKHNVNTTKTAWRPKKVVGSVKPQWRPTGRHFALYDNCPLTRIVEPIVEPLELTPSVSSSSKVTMISRSKGRTVADSIAERLTRPTAYKFKTDCSIIPVWGKKPNLQYFRVFGSLCYPTNDYDDVGKLKAKADIGIFVGYAPTKKAYRIYNKRTRKIQETVHFKPRPEQMTSVPNSTELKLTALQSGRSHSALVKDPEPPSVPPTKKQVDDLFQWFDDDEVVPIPPVVPITPVNVPAAPTPENANGSPSTTVILEGGPAVTESLLPHQIPLPDTSDSDDETLFDHVDSNVFDTPYCS
ncbi:reverse transcriptase domain-containing protein [Tanacetum coccineum]